MDSDDEVLSIRSSSPEELTLTSPEANGEEILIIFYDIHVFDFT